jgi:hypothetical protein
MKLLKTTMDASLLALATAPALANTPDNALVIAQNIDDIVTIDPAKRLADALGLPEGLSNEPARLLLDPAVGGELWAMMLDTAATFDGLVRANAPNAEQAERILANGFYRNIAGALSGTQEYMAAERLHALHADGRFDVVVVDTPPSRHALDFLDAPGTLTRFLDHPLVRLLMLPTRRGLKALNIATQPVLRTIGKVVGGEVLADAGAEPGVSFVEIDLAEAAAADGTILVPAAPGDMRERFFEVENSSTIDIGELDLTLYGTEDDPGPVDDEAIEYQIHLCPTPYTATITGYEPERPDVPIYAYDCATTQQDVTGGWVTVTSGGDTYSVAPGTVDVTENVYVRVTLRLAADVDPSVQGTSATVNYAFDATQRDGNANAQ